MEYYSAVKRNEISSHEKTWRICIKCILLSERSQCGKTTVDSWTMRVWPMWFHLYVNIFNTKYYSTTGSVVRWICIWRGIADTEGWPKVTFELTLALFKGQLYIVYDSNYMTFWRRQNYGDSKKISCYQGLDCGKGREMSRQSTEDFLGQ